MLFHWFSVKFSVDSSFYLHANNLKSLGSSHLRFAGSLVNNFIRNIICKMLDNNNNNNNNSNEGIQTYCLTLRRKRAALSLCCPPRTVMDCGLQSELRVRSPRREEQKIAWHYMDIYSTYLMFVPVPMQLTLPKANRATTHCLRAILWFDEHAILLGVHLYSPE